MQIAFVSLFSSGFASLDTDIERLEIVATASGSFLYSGTGINGGLLVWRLGSAATPAVIDFEYFTTAMRTMGTLGFEWFTLGGQLRTVVGAAQGGDLLSYAIGSDGRVAGLVGTDLDAVSSSGLQTGVVATTLANGTEVMFLADAETGATVAYRPLVAGGMSLIGATAAPGGVPALGPVLLETVTVAGTQLLLRADSALQGVASYRISETGVLSAVTTLGADNGMGINTPTAMVTVSAYGSTFVVLGAAESGSLSVMQLTETGALRPTDHILDTLDTRFDGITALEAVVVDGRVYLIAGGADDGLSLFTLLPDGRLVHVQSLAHQTGFGLENITAIAATVVGDEIQIVVSSGSASGLARLSISLGAQGRTTNGADSGSSVLNGTDWDDLLISNATGSDTLYGGDGDDILVSGPGATRLHGGRGNDLFVMRPGTERQYILDYQDGDRIDLSGLPMLRSTAQLQGTPTETGILLTFLGFAIEVVARNGRPLTLADIWSGLSFGLPDRVMILSNFPGDVIDGDVIDDHIEGSLGGDTILAGAGDDTIFGAESNDWIDGGTGNDSIDGGVGNDTLLGNDGDDWLSGAGGLDSLDGGLGNDTLIGGADRDTLLGGDGADLIDGAGGGNWIDGGAGNDTLTGGEGSDTIVGGLDDDILTGGFTEADLRDMLYGGDGNDSLLGGYGNDELRGDAGNDTLEGGFGADTVIGGTGNDVITAAAWGDLLFGGDGDDFLNGGFGYDRLNGGAGADQFFHLGVAGHGSDWLQDYQFSEGDVLVFGNTTATLSQFQVNFSETENAGQAGVAEAFVIYRPTGQIIWALVDGAAQDHIFLRINGAEYDLLA